MSREKELGWSMGEPNACLMRGLAYLDTDGPCDYEQAFYWIKRASMAGNKEAYGILGEMYEVGFGVVQDEKKAAQLRSVPFVRSGYFPEKKRIFIDRDLLEDIDVSRRAKEKLFKTGNTNKCIACGRESLVQSKVNPGALNCSSELGGCGAILYLPVVEEGLRCGYAIQPYKEYGADGHARAYSFLGGYIHIIKYSARAEEPIKEKMISEIAKRIAECGIIERLISENAKSNLAVVPAPSSVKRKLQHVRLLAELISKERYSFLDSLNKSTQIEAKNRVKGSELGPSEIRCDMRVKGKDILFIDDTYGEGATLRACIRALKSSGAQDIYFLSLCKNTFGGMKGEA